PRVERHVHAGMEDRAPRTRQLAAVAGGEGGARSSEDRDLRGQRGRLDGELAAPDQGLEVAARQRVASRMWHLEADPGQPPVVLDHAANHATLQEDGRYACELRIESVHRPALRNTTPAGRAPAAWAPRGECPARMLVDGAS